MILINSSSRSGVNIFQPFYPIHPPIGIGYLLAAAHSAGINALYIDEQVTEDVVSRARELAFSLEQPYLFGFSVLTASLNNAIEAARKLKIIFPDSVIIFGGVHPTVAPLDILRFPHIDAVIQGEGEYALIEVYNCVKSNTSFRHVDNLAYMHNGKPVFNKSSISPPLDSYPVFPYHLFTDSNYDLGFILSSRGCPYKCIFCSCSVMPGSQSFRFRSSETVADEIDLLYHRHGIRSIMFIDDNFMVNHQRIRQLIVEIKRRGLENRLNYTFQARGDNSDATLFKEMCQVGFKCVLFGLETSSEEIMKTINKGETVAQCIEGIKIAKSAGLTIGATFVFGLPGETRQDRLNCVQLSKQLDIETVRFNNAVPYPGTELFQRAKAENRLYIEGLYDNFIAVSAITENPFKPIKLPYVPVGATEQEIKSDIILAHLSYYLNFTKSIRALFGSGKNAKWFNAGNNFISLLRKAPSLIKLAAFLAIKLLQALWWKRTFS